MIIGISGYAQSGKDTVAKIIRYKTKQNWEIVRFADKVKDILCMLTGCTREQLEDNDFKNTVLGKQWSWGNHNYGPTITYRQALQSIGTDLFRQNFHPDTWVNATMIDYKKRKEVTKEKVDYNNEWFHVHRFKYPNWLIPDVRFPNEVNAIRERGGLVIKVYREGIATMGHISETALDDYTDWDGFIHNLSTIEALEDEVEAFLRKVQLLND